MLVLGIDTSTARASLALYDDQLIAERILVGERDHAEQLVPTIGALMDEAKREFSDLAHIAVCTGPGAFMGLRAGLAAARALALAIDRPAIGISTFDALAATTQTRPLAIILPARQGLLALQCFGPDTPAELVSPKDACGRIPPNARITGLPTAPPLARLIARFAARQAPPASAPPVPLYLSEAMA